MHPGKPGIQRAACVGVLMDSPLKLWVCRFPPSSAMASPSQGRKGRVRFMDNAVWLYTSGECRTEEEMDRFVEWAVLKNVSDEE